MAYADYASELTGHVPSLPFPLAQKIVNRAWQDIRDARIWSFLVSHSQWFAPSEITTGRASVTQNSQTVTGNTAATNSWSGLTNPLITARQFRVGSGGPIYSISAFNGSDTLTLDRNYLEATNASATYSIYQCYFEAPSDFLKLINVINASSGYPLSIHHSKAEVDYRDPTRGSTGLAYWVASFETRGNGVPMYELWPHQTSSQGFQILYQRRGVDFSFDTDALPITVPESLLINRALWYAYQWAAENSARIPELRGVDWLSLRRDTWKYYQDDLMRARKQDESIYQQNIISPPWMRRQLSPIDGRYWQQHDIIGW